MMSPQEDMNQIVKCLLVALCFCLSVAAQTPEACKAQLRHYSVAENEGASYVLLFSEGGAEVYADTRNTDRYSVSVYGINLLIVFQGEDSRQAKIKQLREKYVPQFGSAPIDNLKYADVSLKPNPEIPNKPFDEKWYVAYTAFRQPRACVSDPKKEGINVTQSGKRDAWVPIEDLPGLSKAVQAMLARIKEAESNTAEEHEEKCHAALQHYAVAEYGQAFSNVVASGAVRLPSRLLFSEDGIEVYADTFPNGRADFRTQLTENGLQVLLVYQDESVRQAMIQQLRQTKYALPTGVMSKLVYMPAYAGAPIMPFIPTHPGSGSGRITTYADAFSSPRSSPPTYAATVGMGAPVDNLKYSRIVFVRDAPEPGETTDRRADSIGAWHLVHLEYDQPLECAMMSMNHAVIVETDPYYRFDLKVDAYPLWSKALEAILSWAREGVERTGP